MAARKTISRTVRVRVFERAGGLCHLCGGKIAVSDAWDVDHILALALGGKDDEANFAPAHKRCHIDKTRGDVGMIRKADRQKAKHIGAKASRWPKSKWKRKVNGDTVLREQT